MDLFKEYIVKNYITNVVVGSIFTNEQSNETVHFSNKNELSLITSDDYQDKVIQGILAGIEEFLNQ